MAVANLKAPGLTRSQRRLDLLTQVGEVDHHLGESRLGEPF
jgi:hypothetical protein